MEVEMAKRKRPVRRVRFSSEEIEKMMAEMTSIKCAFCHGTGNDPFGLLSELSTCQVCSGKGEVRIKSPVTKCAFCGGRGIQPHTTSCLHCIACGGKGSVTVVEPSEQCPICKGSGIYPRRPHPMPCHLCKGQGIIPKRGD